MPTFPVVTLFEISSFNLVSAFVRYTIYWHTVSIKFPQESKHHQVSAKTCHVRKLHLGTWHVFTGTSQYDVFYQLVHTKTCHVPMLTDRHMACFRRNRRCMNTCHHNIVTGVSCTHALDTPVILLIL